MVALGSASDDANNQDWHSLQQGQLEGHMRRIDQRLNEQHVALQDVLIKLFEKQMEQIQTLMEQTSSFDRANSEFQDDRIRTELSALTQIHVSEERDQPEPVALSQIPHTEMLNAFRGAVGWQSGAQHASGKLQILHRQSSPNFAADPVQHFFLRIVNSAEFEFITVFIVIVNTVLIAIEADHAIVDSIKTGTYTSVIPKFVEWCFLGIFLLELLLRIMARRCKFFSGNDRWWHIFDVIVVVVASAELLFETINLSFIRILRVFRMMRVFRIIRVFKELRALRVMLSSILVSLLTLIWAFVLLSLIMFLFNIVLIQGAAYYINDHDVLPTSVKDGLEEHFANLGRGMYTLLATISGGKEWSDIANLFWEINKAYFAIVVLYIVFVFFGVLNVVTAVFIESSANISSIDNDLVLQHEMERNESFINQIEMLFREIDEDQSGTLEWTEFHDHLSDPRVLAYLASLQIDISEAKGLFQLLDTDEDGSIAIEEFVLGCMRLKGMAKAIDIAMVMYETKKQVLMNKSALDTLKHSLDGISREVTRNSVLIQRNMHQINDNQDKIRANMAQIHINRSHLRSDSEEGMNQQEVNLRHEYGRKESSRPPYPSSIAIVENTENVFVV